MTVEDAKEVIERLKDKGHSTNEILYMFAKMYYEGEITLYGFEGLVNLLKRSVLNKRIIM